MAEIVNLSDFKGEFSLVANGYTEDKNQEYLDKYEKVYLVSLLGAELYGLFIADLSGGAPQQTRFENIFNPFNIDDDNDIKSSQGMIDMVVAFVYYHIIRDLDFKQTLAGNTRNTSDNSNPISQVQAKVWEPFNKGIDSYWSIQWFVCNDLGTYPEFNGQSRDKISWL